MANRSRAYWRTPALGILAVALAGPVGIRAERSITSECVQGCNQDFDSCKVECLQEQETCLANCGGGLSSRECKQACQLVGKACHAGCGDLKSECKAAFPRGKESPSGPLE